MGSSQGKPILRDEDRLLLAQTSGLTEIQVEEKFQAFLEDHQDKKLRRKDFDSFFSEFLPKKDAEKLESHVFRIYDTNGDGVIDLEQSLEEKNILVENEKYLAIMFFLNDYHKSALSNLPGVVQDEIELTKLLKHYKKRVIKNSEDVLEDLKKILQDCKEREFERIHFHFSGHGKDNSTVLTEENENPSGEDNLPLTAQNSAGECVVGIGHKFCSIHSIKVELSKMKTQKITMTLDCCRSVAREAETFVVYLKYVNVLIFGSNKGCLPNKKRKNFQTSVKIPTYPTLLTTFLTIFNFDKKLRKLPPPSLCQFGRIFVFS